MCQEANIDGKKTNHSLRVAGTSSLFAAGVPEKLIQSRTGHLSLNALRKYERTTDEQHLAVTKILTGDEDSYDVAYKHKSSIPPSSSPIKCEPEPSMPTSVLPNSGNVNYNNCTVNMFTGPPSIHPQFPMYSNWYPPCQPPVQPWQNQPQKWSDLYSNLFNLHDPPEFTDN